MARHITCNKCGHEIHNPDDELVHEINGLAVRIQTFPMKKEQDLCNPCKREIALTGMPLTDYQKFYVYVPG